MNYRKWSILSNIKHFLFNNKNKRKENDIKNKNVVLGMSGGVDSSVAAYLLKKNGYKVIGIFMENWDTNDENGKETCSSSKDYNDVIHVCKHLNIEYKKINFVRNYWNNVFEPCMEDYQMGITPNPDILCNKEIKFKLFLKHALDLKADYVATGHYARLVKKTNKLNEIISVHLYSAKDHTKDQSYFLSGVETENFKNVIFPLGDYTKEKVRKIAKEIHLINATKKDSTGICFVGRKRNFSHFLSQYICLKEGFYYDLNGKIMGKHNKFNALTIGQNAKIPGVENKFYVIGKIYNGIKNNGIILAPGNFHPALYTNYIFVQADKFNWIDSVYKHNNFLPIMESNIKIFCRIRHLDPIISCSISYINEDENLRKSFSQFQSPIIYNNECKNITKQILQIKMDFPKRAATIGQTIALYNENGRCLGGGPIYHVGKTYYENKIDPKSESIVAANNKLVNYI